MPLLRFWEIVRPILALFIIPHTEKVPCSGAEVLAEIRLLKVCLHRSTSQILGVEITPKVYPFASGSGADRTGERTGSENRLW